MNGNAESLVAQPSLPWLSGGMLAAGVSLGAVVLDVTVGSVRRAKGRCSSTDRAIALRAGEHE